MTFTISENARPAPRIPDQKVREGIIEQAQKIRAIARQLDVAASMILETVFSETPNQHELFALTKETDSLAGLAFGITAWNKGRGR